MSFFGLSLIGSALDAFQTSANITSDNIANVNTPGASRQTANLTANPPITGSPFYSDHTTPGTLGDGVLLSSIGRIHQDSYDALFRGASTEQNYYTVQNQQLTATQSALGEPNAGINSAYVAFQSSVQTLAGNPSGTAERSGVISAANTLVGALNSANAAVVSQESTVKDQATSLISSVNGLLDTIASLNGQIRALKAVGDNPNTYLDQRDHAIDQLATYLQTTTSIQSNGSALVTVNGLALVNDTEAYHIQAPVVGKNANGTPALQINFDVPPYPGASSLVPVTGGQLGGLVDLYNNKLLTYGNSLDEFASGLAAETSRLSKAAYDQNGLPGTALFVPVVSQLPVGAGNIKVGITDPTEVPASTATTQAGTLTKPANAANQVIDTTSSLQNGAYLNPAATPTLTGTLTITIDNIVPAPVFTYNATNTTSADAFINSFNAGHYGVTASFDSSSQRIVFARDPANIDEAHRANQGNGVTTPDFTIVDSNVPTAGLVPGGTTASILQVFGAAAIQGVPQNPANGAFGAASAGGANALLTLFTANLGIPGTQTTSTAASAAGAVTITEPTPGNFGTINVGDVITLDALTPGATENVTVTAVNRITGTISFTAKNAHAAGYSISAAQTTTLQNQYAAFVARLGLDAATAKTGEATQTQLASNIDKTRQGIDGINIDEETQNLIKYQNAYGAAAHTISVLNILLGDALALIGGSAT